MSIENGLKTVKTLFDGSKKFKIPEYQRPYAWGEKQLEDFFYDFFYQSVEQKYFYGTILLNESSSDEDFDVLDIVDGQQRLTTLIIFISILIKIIEKSNPNFNASLKKDIYLQYHGIFKLVQNNLDNDFFQTYILGDDNGEELIATSSQNRLWFAKSHLINLIEKEKLNSERLEEILKIIDKTEVLVYSVENSAEATLIFETTNDRGKSLSNLEKMKSFMMYKCFLSNQPNKNDLIKNIDSRFGEIYRILEDIKPLFENIGIKSPNEDQLTQYHFIGYFNWTKKADYQNYLDNLKVYINRLLQDNKLEEANNYIDKYSKSLKEYYIAIKNILNSNSINLKELSYLGRIAVFYPLVFKAFMTNRNDIERLLKEIIDFSFIVFGLKMRRTNDVDVFFNSLSKNFDGDYIKLIQSIKEKKEEVAEKKKILQKCNSQFFFDEYGSEVKNYLFWRYENNLRTIQPVMNPMPIDDLINKDEQLRPTIEHIQAKAVEWDDDIDEIQKEEFKENYENCIGNLVLDPKSANSSKGKKKWEIKNENYFTNSALKSQLELHTFLSDDNWNKFAIEKRQKILINFIEKTWLGDIDEL